MQHGPRILVQDATMIKMYRGSRCNEDEDATRIKMQHGSTCNQSGERYNAPYVAITIRLGQMNGLFEVFLFIVLQSLTNSWRSAVAAGEHGAVEVDVSGAGGVPEIVISTWCLCSLIIARAHEHFVTKYTITDVSKRGGAHDVTQVLFFFIVVSITQCTAVSRSVSMWSSDLAGTQAKMDPD